MHRKMKKVKAIWPGCCARSICKPKLTFMSTKDIRGNFNLRFAPIDPKWTWQDFLIEIDEKHFWPPQPEYHKIAILHLNSKMDVFDFHKVSQIQSCLTDFRTLEYHKNMASSYFLSYINYKTRYLLSKSAPRYCNTWIMVKYLACQHYW